MLCVLLYPTGGCINASPAGKRRIAAAAEQQQFGSSYGNSGGLYGNLLDDSDGSTSASGLFSRVGSPFTTITAIAVAACLLIVTVFALIFAVLQVSTKVLRHFTAYKLRNQNVRFLIYVQGITQAKDNGVGDWGMNMWCQGRQP